MTLTTSVRIVEPTPVRPVFDKCRRLLGAENALYSEDDDGNRSFSNRLGQGYVAWLTVTYGADNPLREEARPNRPKASIEVKFDTSYGYQADNGANCEDLHAWLVMELGRWLNQRDLTWYWHNEYTGEWFRGLDGLAAFGNPVKGALLEPAEPVA